MHTTTAGEAQAFSPVSRRVSLVCADDSEVSRQVLGECSPNPSGDGDDSAEGYEYRRGRLRHDDASGRMSGIQAIARTARRGRSTPLPGSGSATLKDVSPTSQAVPSSPERRKVVREDATHFSLRRAPHGRQLAFGSKDLPGFGRFPSLFDEWAIGFG